MSQESDPSNNLPHSGRSLSWSRRIEVTGDIRSTDAFRKLPHWQARH